MNARYVTIKAATLEDGDALRQRAIDELGAWGGMAYAEGRTDDLEARIELDPRRVDGGPGAIIAWCEGLGVEWSAEFSGWDDE